MNILFIGDIVGRSGREALRKHLPTLKNQYEPDIIIVNADNASHGRGLNIKQAREFFDWGVDVITTGDHVWDQREMIGHIGNEPHIIRAINFNADAPGNGYVIHTTSGGKKILVIHAIGRVFMDPINDPFAAIDAVLAKHPLSKAVDAIFVDFHAEASSEKMAMAHHLDGRVSGIIGTHTHIPTADAHILNGGTAFMSDAGMTGDYDSVIGAVKHTPLQKFRTGLPGAKLEPAGGEATLCGAVVNVGNDGKAKGITPVKMGGVLGN